MYGELSRVSYASISTKPVPVVVTLGECMDLGVDWPSPPGDTSPGTRGRGERLDSGEAGPPGGSLRVELKLSRLG